VVGGWSTKAGVNTAITWSAGTATTSVSGKNDGYLFNAPGSVAVKAIQPQLVQSGVVRDLPVRDAVVGRGTLAGLTEDDTVYGTDSNMVAVRWTCPR
jgi:hypothetical protein